jgi:ABC-type Zn uptake system ZnuABC Zn-binding protein ZnuA
MKRSIRSKAFVALLVPWAGAAILLSACGATATPAGTANGESAAGPTLQPVTLAAGEKLRVVATTNILGDVVHQVGGDRIELTTLLPVGADPHSYSASPQDLRMLSGAQVVFMVGEGVEETLLPVVENREGNSARVAVNTGLALQALPADGHEEAGENADGDDHTGEAHHHTLDPHTWTAVPSVLHWVERIEQSLSTLDPANAATYQANAAAYRAKLEELDQEIQRAVAAIPAANRKLVTDHDDFGYFADRYGFTIVGAVIPSFSTLAAPSAQELAALHQQVAAEGVKAIFVGTTVNPDLADQLAHDLGIAVVPLYTDSLSGADGPAATYLDMMRFDVKAIIDALQ